MNNRPQLTNEQARTLADLLSKLFPQSEWTIEQFDLFMSRVKPYTMEAARAGMEDHRASHRFHAPVLKDLLESIAKRQAPFERGEYATTLERHKRSEEAYHREKAREVRVSLSMHIPHLLDMGEAKALQIRDGLIERMGNGEYISQRNIAGCPTWAELTNPDEVRSRILCWRYWIIFDSFEAYEPEMAFT
jgi:hypothetical protein